MKSNKKIQEIRKKQILLDKDLSNLDLSGIYLSSKGLIRVKFNNSNLSSTNLNKTNLVNENLTNTNLFAANTERINAQICTTTKNKKELNKRYRVLVIDPPWNQGKTGKRKVRPNQTTMLDYPTMSKKELLELPVNQWAQDQSFLWLWATNSKDRNTGEPILKTAFDLIEEWGFTFYTIITWNKRTGPCPFGPYQITTEHILFGYKGKAIFNRNCLGKMQTCFTATPTIHSAKPDFFYQEIAKYFEGPRLDVFARQVREGYDGWGNQYGSLTINARRPSVLRYAENHQNS